MGNSLLAVRGINYKYIVVACKFFKNFPAFTKEGKLDMDWLVGMRVLIRLASTENGWEIAGVSYDYQYYGMDEEQESGGENGEK